VRGGRSSGTVTVLFTDLVGSTDLLSHLGETTFDDLRRAHFAALREAIERSGGEEVKTLGDGVLAIFGSAADAVTCAVAMQQAADRQARDAPAALAIRVGLALGDVSFEEGDVFGAPVVEAARLVAAAGSGQILTTSVVPVVAGGRSEACFTDLGPLELKGLPQPVGVCEVAWEPLPAPSVPLPALLTDRGRIFVGRERELERLGQLWKEATAGELRIALLAGEPGVGKTRLAAELAGRVSAEGATVLAGRCDEDLGVPYQPFVDALRHFVDHTPPEELAGRLGRYPGELVRLVPELGQRLPDDLPPPLRSDPETERYRLFDAVDGWLRGVSAEAPLLLVLDDLQWAAKPTLLLLRHVVRSAEPARLLIAATYRDTDIARGHPLTELLADLRRGRGAERLSLTGLDVPGVAAFLEEAAGHALSEEGGDLARAVWAETEGNPFFVVEVLRHLSEVGALERREGRWVATPALEVLGIPEGVRDVVGRRLSRLSEATNRALTLAAVVGLEFDPAVVAAAGGMGEDDLLAAVEEAAAARLVAEVPGAAPRNRFSHALVRATLYDELSAGRRVTFHRKVAEAIEAVHGQKLDEHLPALAHHWARASAPAAEAGKAIDYATRAGDRALAQLAHDEAVAYYRQALDLLEASGAPADNPQRLELFIALGEAQRRAGDPAYRETLLSAAHLAQQRADAGALARAALANTRGALYSTAGKVDQDRVAALEAALGAIGDGDSRMRARLLANLGLELTWADRERARRLSDDALELARRLGDPGTLVEVLSARYYSITAPDNQAERLESTGELVSLTEQLGDAVGRSRALALRFRVAMESADIEEADRCLEINERLTAELGQPMLRWLVGLQRAGRALLAGRLDEADRLALDAFELGRLTGQPDAPAMFLAQQAVIRFEQGRLEELEDQLVRFSQANPGLSASAGLVVLAYCELGRTELAREAFERLAVSDFADLPFDAVWLRCLTECAVACARLGDVVRARVLHHLLGPYAGQLPVFAIGTAGGSVSHYLGLLATTLGSFDEAETRFAAAAATHERLGAPTWLARTRLEWARMLLTRRQAGDVERARDLLGPALVIARELGLGKVERDAAALLG
jgi:class 3 adenylate cyclase/tetratricopeptide (TPR) repeat protein